MKPLPEIDPTILLAEPYNFKTFELANTLGCSIHTIESWRYNRRQPQAPVKKLAAVVKKKLDRRLRHKLAV
jgi:DNA-binding transcriptional regulator YiaG